MSLGLEELAEALGVTKQAVSARARREGWPYQEETCRGGRRRVYPQQSLPAEVRKAVVRQQAAAYAPEAPAGGQAVAPAEPAGLPAGITPGAAMDGRGLTERQRAKANERLRIITPLLRLEPGSRDRKALAQGISATEGPSVATLYRWEKAYREGGLAALAPKARRDRGQSRELVSRDWHRAARAAGISKSEMAAIDAELTDKIRGLWAQGAPSIRQCQMLARAWLVDRAAQAGMEMATAMAVCEVPKHRVEREQDFRLVAQYERDAKGVYDHVEPGIRRTRAGLAPGDVVFGDVSPDDIPVYRPDGSVAYPRLIVWQDAATNWLHVSAFLAEKGENVRREHVALAFTDMAENAPFGLPAHLYLDNGQEYRWEEMLSGWSELARLAGRVKVYADAGTVTRTRPYRPRAKALEGQFSNLAYYLGWHPSFQGGDRMRKKAANLGQAPQPIPYEEYLQQLADAVASYHATPQSGHLGERSPSQAIEAALEGGWSPVRADQAALMLAFSEEKERWVRSGRVQVGGRYYYADELVGVERKLRVRWPMHDPRCCFVFDQGALQAVALPETEFGLMDAAGAAEEKRRRKLVREVVQVRRGQVADVRVQDLVRRHAELGGSDAAVERAIESDGAQIAISDEAQQMKEALAQQTQQALTAAHQREDPSQLSQWQASRAYEEDPEMARYRAMFADEDEDENDPPRAAGLSG
ncbi:helix-turn-helix domain-containing protein [Ectothiorhodospira mobilis]|uniref:helix-turn-helix domain-containing protein n=1 Tax=Ectothiorhodospira mobilis TaxID=195064 RepID=UPI00190442FE|nr:helix-turn-helix domain-containing protein [Ectothiorhodospira mobilis]MBK1691005.1 hypothetical protein [Ectothiorhodospira mobilis]